MLRRALCTFILLVPAAWTAAGGCGGEPLPQDLCNWLADSNNCYARYADDVGTQCGYPFVTGSDPAASATGSFASRDDLSICVKGQGGQIIFDPPLDLSAFPLTSVAFKMLDAKAAECGSGSISGLGTYSITVNPVSAADAGASGPIDDDIIGGTFSVESPADRDVMNVTCSGGSEGYNFNTLVTSKCAQYQGMLPRAVIDSSPGIPQSSGQAAVAGYVRARIEFPPDDPAAAGAAVRVVEYFNCSIPAPPPPCQDGVKNFSETDVDCGGNCPSKCAAGLACSTGSDCASGNCALNAGVWQCQ